MMTETTAYARLLRAFTRRSFLQRTALIAAATVAVTLTRLGLPVPPAFASSCNWCFGNCHPCFSAIWYCSSPNGAWDCGPGGCVCNSWEASGQYCSPPCFYAFMTCCDDGTRTIQCNACP